MNRKKALCLSGPVLMVGVAWFAGDVWLEALGRFVTASLPIVFGKQTPVRVCRGRERNTNSS